MLKYNRTNVYDFNFHLVFVTKYRQKIFDTQEKQDLMKNILKTIAEGNDVIIQSIEVLTDHIHLLISFPPDKTPSSVVKSFKGTAAREWFKQYPETKQQLWKGHLWSPSYFMSTLGDMSKDIVTKYINNQLTTYNAGRPRR